ncbi:MAG TPA: P1 family peptidase [Thermoleophilia bacterium]|nr:P1 family peptidase [Thermoleophilia bacterium]
MSARPRARDLGIPFEGTPGPWNAITDVASVEVGFTTLIQGEGALEAGCGPVRTGVTVILPRGKHDHEPVFSAYFAFNGMGEVAGALAVAESGKLSGPIGITNTHSTGVVRDALVAWSIRTGVPGAYHLPMVAETFDGYLNDIDGLHVRPEHVYAAIESATSGHVAEGNVGGGTGMILHGFKGGTGTASRVVEYGGREYRVGVLVQGNTGTRPELRIAGAPVGRELLDYGVEARQKPTTKSVIVIVATDAPLDPHYLERVAKRPVLGMGRLGNTGHETSGDIFVAFSTAAPEAPEHLEEPEYGVPKLPLTGRGLGAASDRERATPSLVLSLLFQATVEATEEAIVNALVGAEDMTGRDGRFVAAIPHRELREALRKYNRLLPQTHD